MPRRPSFCCSGGQPRTQPLRIAARSVRLRRSTLRSGAALRRIAPGRLALGACGSKLRTRTVALTASSVTLGARSNEAPLRSGHRH